MNGALREIRTPDPLVRSQVLYPAELWAHFKLFVAVREGFEPSVGFKTHAPLAGEYLQPLGHLTVTSRHNTN